MTKCVLLLMKEWTPPSNMKDIRDAKSAGARLHRALATCTIIFTLRPLYENISQFASQGSYDEAVVQQFILTQTSQWGSSSYSELLVLELYGLEANLQSGKRLWATLSSRPKTPRNSRRASTSMMRARWSSAASMPCLSWDLLFRKNIFSHECELISSTNNLDSN